MPHRFRHHYTREEARALLPQVRRWLEELLQDRHEAEKLDRRLEAPLAAGQDMGGTMVNRSVSLLAKMRGVFLEFHRRDIQIKDLERGLLDFPALINGREVFLCWEKDEDDIEYWHDIDAGFAGREPLD